jgi:hypothetical protein
VQLWNLLSPLYVKAGEWMAGFVFIEEYFVQDRVQREALLTQYRKWKGCKRRR